MSAMASRWPARSAGQLPLRPGAAVAAPYELSVGAGASAGARLVVQPDSMKPKITLIAQLM